MMFLILSFKDLKHINGIAFIENPFDMNYIKQIERLQFLNKLIIQKKTGSPVELAERLRLSKRQIYNLIDELKDLGVPIFYCKKLKSYCYKESFKLNIQFSLTLLEGKEEKKISGGFFNKDKQCNFFSLYKNTLVTYSL